MYYIHDLNLPDLYKHIQIVLERLSLNFSKLVIFSKIESDTIKIGIVVNLSLVSMSDQDIVKFHDAIYQAVRQSMLESQIKFQATKDCIIEVDFFFKGASLTALVPVKNTKIATKPKANAQQSTVVTHSSLKK